MKKEKINIVSVLSSSEVVKGLRLDEATQQGMKDLDSLFQESVRRSNQDIAQKQGFIFEYLESYKFNQDAVMKGENFRSVVSSTIEGQGTSPADVIIKDIKTQDILSEAQLKSSKDIYYPMKEFFRDKYQGMDKVTNPEHADRLIELYEKRLEAKNIYEDKYKELIKSVKGELSYKDVSSGGTSYKEVVDITENYERFVRNEKVKLLIKELGVEIGFAVGVAALLTGAIDVAQKRKVDKETLDKIFKSSFKAGGSALVSNILRKMATGSKTNVPAVLASTAVNVVETTYKVLKKEITVEEGLIKVGSTTSSSMSALYFAGVGTVIGGPIGGIIGGVVGYAVASPVFGMLDKTLKDLKVLRKERVEMEKAFNIFKTYMEAHTIYLISRMEYIERRYKEASYYLESYRSSGDGKYLDKVYSIFGYIPPSDEEIKRKILEDDLLIFE